MNQLKLFYENKELSNTIKSLFIDTLSSMALEDLKKDVDARYLAKAIEGIEKAYIILEVEFEKQKPLTDINEAR